MKNVWPKLDMNVKSTPAQSQLAFVFRNSVNLIIVQFASLCRQRHKFTATRLEAVANVYGITLSLDEI